MRFWGWNIVQDIDQMMKRFVYISEISPGSWTSVLGLWTMRLDGQIVWLG